MNSNGQEFINYKENNCSHEATSQDEQGTFCEDCGKDLTEATEAKHQNAQEAEATGN